MPQRKQMMAAMAGQQDGYGVDQRLGDAVGRTEGAEKHLLVDAQRVDPERQQHEPDDHEGVDDDADARLHVGLCGLHQTASP